jgi:hypothetical protein
MANPPVTATNVAMVGLFRVSRSRGVILIELRSHRWKIGAISAIFGVNERQFFS